MRAWSNRVPGRPVCKLSVCTRSNSSRYFSRTSPSGREWYKPRSSYRIPSACAGVTIPSRVSRSLRAGINAETRERKGCCVSFSSFSIVLLEASQGTSPKPLIRSHKRNIAGSGLDTATCKRESSMRSGKIPKFKAMLGGMSRSRFSLPPVLVATDPPFL